MTFDWNYFSFRGSPTLISIHVDRPIVRRLIGMSHGIGRGGHMNTYQGGEPLKEKQF